MDLVTVDNEESTQQPLACIDTEWTDYQLLRKRVKDKKKDAVKYLIDRRCRVNNTYESPSDTPLHYAVKSGDFKLVEILLSAGAWPEVANERGKTPLHFAVEARDNRIIDFVLANVAFTGFADSAKKSELLSAFKACLKNSTKTVEAFLRSGFDVNIAVPATSPLWPKYTLLHFAAEYGHVNTVKLLLKHNAGIRMKNFQGYTPLHLAAQQKDTEIIDILLVKYKSYHEGQIDTDELDLAIQQGNSDLINETLSKQNVPKNRRKGDSFSGLHVACIKSDMKLLVKLIQKPGQINKCVTCGLTDWLGYTPLHFAVEYSSKEVVMLLLENGADINAKNSKGLTPLCLAVQHRRIEILASIIAFTHNKVQNGSTHRKIYSSLIETIVNSDVSVNTFDRQGNSLLHLVVKSSSCYPGQLTLNMLILLLGSGADVGLQNFEGLTPLHFAFIKGRWDIINLLTSADRSYERRVNPTDFRGLSHFHAACMRNDAAKVEIFLENGVDINSVFNPNGTAPDSFEDIFSDSGNKRLSIHAVDGNSESPSSSVWCCKYTPLHFAVKNKCSKVVELLVAHQADVSVRTAADETPLHLASLYPNKEVIESLIRGGAGIHDKCRKGMTPLHLAVIFNHLEAIEVLLKNGADMHMEDDEGFTVLDSRYSSHDDARQFLLRNVVDVTFRDKHGMTLLHKAVEENRPIQVQILLDRGLDINCADDKEHQSPLHWAAQKHIPEMVDLLLGKGANVDARNKNGETALHVMTSSHEIRESKEAIRSFNKMIKSLLSFGCQLETPDSLGRTPLHTASLKRNKNAIQALLQNLADFNIEDNKGRTPVSYIVNADPSLQEIFLNHGQKLMAIGYHVSEKNQKCFSEMLYKGYSIREDFPECCTSEIEKLRKFAVTGKSMARDSYTSMYDIIVRDGRDMILLLENEEFTSLVESSAFDEIFPLYGYLIKSQVERAVLAKAYEEAKKSLIRMGLPHLCSDKILEYLTDGHIDLLNRAHALKC